MEAVETIFEIVRCGMKSLASIQIDLRTLENIEDGLTYYLSTFSVNMIARPDDLTAFATVAYSALKLMDCFKIAPYVRCDSEEIRGLTKSDPIATLFSSAHYVLRLISQHTYAQAVDHDVEVPAEFKDELTNAFTTFLYVLDKCIRRANQNDNILTVCNQLLKPQTLPNA